MITRFILIIFLTFICNGLQCQTMEVTIQNFKNCEGQLCVAIFNSEESFKNEKPVWEKYFPKNDLLNKTLKFTIRLAPGTYGLSILDDINMDSKMNFNIIGIPREGYGFGNYQHRGILKPKFSAFSSDLRENEIIYVNVNMQYF